MDDDELISNGEAARLLGLRPESLTNLAALGTAPVEPVMRTTGGHRRYRRSDVARVVEGLQVKA